MHPSQLPCQWDRGVDLGTPVPRVRLCRQLGKAVRKPWSLLQGSAWRINQLIFALW